jgi:hypothetical protein
VKERHVLQEYVEGGVRTVRWSENREAIVSLAHDGILIPIGNPSGSVRHFRISDDAFKYLLQNRAVLATPGEPRPPRSDKEWMI